MSETAESERHAWNRCPRCRLVRTRCVCAEVPRIANRTEVLVVQHPREQHHPIGTARFVDLGLERSQIVVADRIEGTGDERERLIAGIGFPKGAALLFPSEDARDVETLSEGERPDCLIVIDGTWSQAKRLFLDDPRLAALPKVRFTPEQESRYRIRREPQKDFVSTVESIAEVLRSLEPGLPGLNQLVESFERMVVRQEQIAKGPERQPRYQSPRQRESRKVPAEMHSDGLAVVYGEMARGIDGLPEVVQWASARLTSGSVSDRLLRPRSGVPNLRHLEHAGLRAEAVESGTDLATLRQELLGDDGPSVLASWGGRSLAIARDHLGWTGPSLNLRAIFSNLRGHPDGDSVAIAEQLGRTVGELPVRGRAGPRLAAAMEIAGWIRSVSPTIGE